MNCQKTVTNMTKFSFVCEEAVDNRCVTGKNKRNIKKNTL